MKELDKMLSDLFSKLPALPAKAKEVLVKLAPYFAIIGIVLSLPAILALLGLGALGGSLMAATGSWGYAGSGMLAIVFAVVSVVLLALSVKGLFARSASGWQYLYYNTLVGAAYSLIRVDIAGFVIGTGISLYILFQVRSYYR
jgi:hypothetical protein